MTIEEVLAIEDPTGFAIALSDLVYGPPAGGFETLRPAERVVWCIAGLEREVNNGGLHLFFVNSAGDQRAGPSRRSAPSGRLSRGAPSPDRDTRQPQVDPLPEEAPAHWEALDRTFYCYEDDLTALLRAYVARNTADFR